jgi:tetratricopeptide (TPR) repeat protein
VTREEAFTAWRQFLEAMAARRPSIFVLEDLHWADQAMLDFVEHVLGWSTPVPALLLCTARPELFERSPNWGGGQRNATTISLSPLSAEESGSLLHALLDRTVLPAETQSVLLERTGGNPLYAEQFARMLLERGDVERLAVPETLQALVTARLDTLPPDLKAVLQDASVIGRVFWTGAVAEMTGRPRDDIRRDLNELARRDFVRPVRVSSIYGEDELSFWYALVRDVAYQQIPRSVRADKHVAAARWVEASARDRLDDHAEILAHHFQQAMELSRAAGTERPELRESLVRCLGLAGDRAMRLDIAAAEGSYRRALELSDGAARAELLAKLADALQEQGRLPEAEAAYEDALPAFRAEGNDHAAAVAMIGLARALWRHGRTARAHELTREAIPILERRRGPDLLRAYASAAGEETIGGRSEEGLAWAEKGIALAGELGIENIVRPLQFRGLARLDLGDSAGLSDMRNALDLSLRLGLGYETATSYGNLGESVTAFEGLAPGLELVDAGLDFARRRGLTHHEMWSVTGRLVYLYELGHWDELLREAEDVIRWDREEGGSTQIEVWALMARCPVYVHRGAVDEARRDVATFLPRAREVANPQTLTPALALAALAFAAVPDPGEAVALIQELERTGVYATSGYNYPFLPAVLRICVAADELALAESLVIRTRSSVETPLSRHVASSAKAILAEAHGDTRGAAAFYAETAAGWEEWGSAVERAYALLGLGRCGDEEAARAAAAVFEELGATPLTTVARAA